MTDTKRAEFTVAGSESRDKYLAKFPDIVDKLAYLLELTHYDYWSGADAYYRMAKLFPLLHAEFKRLRAQLDAVTAERDAWKESFQKVLLHSDTLEFYSGCSACDRNHAKQVELDKWLAELDKLFTSPIGDHCPVGVDENGDVKEIVR